MQCGKNQFLLLSTIICHVSFGAVRCHLVLSGVIWCCQVSFDALKCHLVLTYVIWCFRCHLVLSKSHLVLSDVSLKVFGDVL